MPAFKLLQSLSGPGGHCDHEKLCKQYWDIERTGIECQELRAFDTDIEKDLLRTFPSVPQFQFHHVMHSTEPSTDQASSDARLMQVPLSVHGIHIGHSPTNLNQNPNYYRLKRVLSAFSYYDHSIGYMQGMNFIAATLMYHCNEEVAFWLFVHLMQMSDVRSIY